MTKHLVPTPNPLDLNAVRRSIQKLAKKLGPDGTPTVSNLTISDLTASRLIASDSSKKLVSTDIAAWVLQGSANQVVVTDESDGTVTLSLPQNFHTGATPTLAGLTITNAITEFSTDGTLGGNSDSALPTEKAVKTYVDLAIGASKDYFLSDNDDSGIADYHILYETDTGEAASTLLTGTMGVADDQLMFSYITPSGVPGVTFLRAGIYILHTHLAVTTGNRTTKFYWTLSKRILAGTETVLMTSEESSAIPGTMASFITHATLTSDATILTTDRLVLKLHANVTGGGNDTVVTIYMEGTNDCHITNLLPSDIWQNQGDVLDDLNTLGANTADNEFLASTGAGVLAWETGATVRTSLGLAIGTNVQAYHATLAAIVAGTWTGAASITTLGTIVTGTWGATDVGIAHGGTGQSTAQAAIDALSAVSGATNEHVLTKDTASGNAIFKAAAGGVSTFVALTDTPANFTGKGGYGTVVNAGETALEFLKRVGVETTSRTVNLDSGMSQATLQATIDAVGRYLLPDVTITFQFADGTYTLTDRLLFNGFLSGGGGGGGGGIIIQGNISEANATALHTTQEVILDGSSITANVLDAWYNGCSTIIKNFQLKCNSDAGYYGCYIRGGGESGFYYNYVLGDGTGNGFGLRVAYGGCYTVKNYVSNMKYGIGVTLGLLVSSYNDETGTDPVYGLAAQNAGRIGKSGTQPTGSTADEYTSVGGEIS